MTKTRRSVRLPFCLGVLIFTSWPLLASAPATGKNPLALPEVGNLTLNLLSPTLLELGLVTSKSTPQTRITQWDFVTSDLQLRPTVSDFAVTVDGQAVSLQALGFRRRPLYAPFKKR